MLRSTLRVEPNNADWLIITPEYVREFSTVDETEVPFSIATPDSFPGRLQATIVVESNGGKARVGVVVESPIPRGEEPLGPFEGGNQGSWSPELLTDTVTGWIARRGGRSRILGGAALGFLLRLGVGAASGFTSVALLPGPAVVLGVIGGILGGMGCFRRGGVWDIPSGVFSGAFSGMLIAILLVATCQAVEPLFGVGTSSNLVMLVLLWGFLGAGLGAGSLRVVPYAGRNLGNES
ncbi:hypothetical protein [Tautonia rosea]|uniref:hypothetical protein n=1 Tax=Tautonia rosea TaxID=2728037 RepID=UPI001F28C4C6|nr:hypothetical protein [Tautonia rosea]